MLGRVQPQGHEQGEHGGSRRGGAGGLHSGGRMLVRVPRIGWPAQELARSVRREAERSLHVGDDVRDATRPHCGSDDCGSDDCGSDDCGSDDCGSDDCGSDDCGSDDCGSDDCGSDDCGSDDCGSDDCGSDDCGSDDCGSDDCGSDDCARLRSTTGAAFVETFDGNTGLSIGSTSVSSTVTTIW